MADSQTVDLSQYCSDPDGHPLTYRASFSEPSNVTPSVDGSTLTLTGVAVGSLQIIVTATDPFGDFDDEEFTATVDNRDPVCEDVDDQTVTAGKSKTLTVSCTDPDGHSLTYEASSSDAGKVTVSNDEASVTITGVVAGIPTVTVTASDKFEGSDTKRFGVTVPNRPPVCSDIPAQTFVVADSQTVDLSQYCSDPDGDDITYSANSSATSNVTVTVINYLDSNRGTLTLPTGKAIGSSTITVKASDGSLSTTKTLTARVDNRDPECEDIAGQTVYVNASKTLTVSCTDPDGHSLSYSASSSDTSKATASMDGSSVTITGVAAGTATVSVTATDGYGGSDTETFTVTVKKRPPSPTASPNYS